MPKPPLTFSEVAVCYQSSTTVTKGLHPKHTSFFCTITSGKYFVRSTASQARTLLLAILLLRFPIRFDSFVAPFPNHGLYVSWRQTPHIIRDRWSRRRRTPPQRWNRNRQQQQQQHQQPTMMRRKNGSSCLNCCAPIEMPMDIVEFHIFVWSSRYIWVVG